MVDISIWLWLGASGAAFIISIYPLWEAWMDRRMVKSLKVTNGRLAYTTHALRGQFLKTFSIFLMLITGLILAFLSPPRPDWAAFVLRGCIITIPALLAIDAWYEHWYRVTINRTVK